jgi:hypothetical protein
MFSGSLILLFPSFILHLRHDQFFLCLQIAPHVVRYGMLYRSDGRLHFGKAHSFHFVDELKQERREVVLHFLRAFARAMHSKVRRYFYDESYIHTNYAASQSWQVSSRACRIFCVP